MKTQDFENAFGRAPDSFELAMRRALKEEPKMRRMRARGLLIACVLALVLIGTAFAATKGFGLLDMLSERLPTGDQAQDMVQTVTQPPAQQKDYRVAIEQAICDGMQAYFTARISPTDPGKTLLIPWAEQTSAQVEGADKSYAELAKEGGKQLFVISAHNAWSGELDPYIPGELGIRRDGDDLVISYAVPAVPDEDDDTKLTLHTQVVGYELYEGANHRDSWQRIDATAQIEYTKDVKGYSWQGTKRLPQLGIQLTQVRVYDSPVTRSLEIRYKQLPGLDQADQAVAQSVRLCALDANGEVIPSAYDGMDDSQGEERVLSMVLPADDTGGITLGHYDWTIGRATVSFRLDTKDATAIDMQKRMEENARRIREQAKETQAQRAKDEAQYQAQRSATPAPIPEGAKQVELTGTAIPVLRELDTEYKALTGRIEAIAGAVNLSAQTKDYAITIDQVTATDSSMMVFYTFKSRKKLQRDEDPSINGWNAKRMTPMLLEARFDGSADAYQVITSIGEGEQFFVDDHTTRGYAVMTSRLEPVLIPEKCYVTLNCAGFHTQDDSLQVSFLLDRSAAQAGIVQKDLAIDASFTMKDKAKSKRNVAFTHIAQSPFMTTLNMVETKTANGHTQYVVRDESGRQVRAYFSQGSIYDAIDADHPVTEHRQMLIQCAQDAKTLTFIPVVGGGGRAGDFHFVDVAAPMPQVIEFESGMTMTIHDLQVDTSGLMIRYEGAANEAGNFLDLGKDKSKDYAHTLDVTTVSRTVDRETGIVTETWRWTPQKGAKKGARVKQSTLDQYKYLWISATDFVLDPAQAVTVELG